MVKMIQLYGKKHKHIKLRIWQQAVNRVRFSSNNLD